MKFRWEGHEINIPWTWIAIAGVVIGHGLAQDAYEQQFAAEQAVRHAPVRVHLEIPPIQSTISMESIQSLRHSATADSMNAGSK